MVDGAGGNPPPQYAGADPPGAGLNIPCQDVNFREIQDMKRRSKHFMLCPDSTSIAEM